MLGKKTKFSEKHTRFAKRSKSEDNNDEETNNQRSKSKEKNNRLKKVRDSNGKKSEIDTKYRDFSKEITQKYEKLQHKYPKINFDRDRNIELKRCEKCSEFNSKMFLCEICDDAYHLTCLNPVPQKAPQNFVCVKCNFDMKNNKDSNQKKMNTYDFTVTVQKITKVK